MVQDYDGVHIDTNKGQYIAETMIWAAGVAGKRINGLPEEVWTQNNRILTDEFNQVNGLKNIYAVGDIALTKTSAYPDGHPQVAQVAIQQAVHLSKNLMKKENRMHQTPFEYRYKGSLATIGRKLAVADLPGVHLGGFVAWILWLLVHLMAIVGVRNRLFIFLNWMWNYITYDQSLRLLIRPKIFRYHNLTE